VELPAGTERIEAALYYQTTSREFIEFLRDEINGVGDTLSGIGAGGDPAYIAQTNDFFNGLAAWGDTIWQLWEHNKDIPGAKPVLMTNTLVQLDVTDTDGDGIPAYWETQYFGGPTNALATGHGDTDGINNYNEYIALTDPTDSTSALNVQFDRFSQTSELTFTAFFARDYELLYSTNLIDGVWSNLYPKPKGLDAPITLLHTNMAPQGFYKIEVGLP
ncbi:MAG: hypothetical protein OEL75_04270, partial [Kiritimatiellaceae bacterium]|nr:hypothetical protein [Kiritimatiellaceae bacterium]